MAEHLKYLIVLVPVVGLGMFVWGVFYRMRLKERVVGYERTQGVVVDSIERMGGGFDPAPVYSPEVEYFVGSARFTVSSAVGYGQKKKKGSKLTVTYSPANPATAFIVEDYYLAANVVLALGGAFVLMGSLFAYHLLFG